MLFRWYYKLVGISVKISTGMERSGPNASIVPDSNPDPERFVIDMTYEAGTYLCAMVTYLNCTNYEGRKVLAFENMTHLQLHAANKIDPHFMEDGKVIARFRPDQYGWQDAIDYITTKADK